MSRLDEIKERVGKATKGPWYPRATDDNMYMNARYVGLNKGPGWKHDDKCGLAVCIDQEPADKVIAITLLQSPDLVDQDECDENTVFIAHSREDIPYLLERLEAAEKALGKYSNDESWSCVDCDAGRTCMPDRCHENLFQESSNGCLEAKEYFNKWERGR
jgi:hypothetical protein